MFCLYFCRLSRFRFGASTFCRAPYRLSSPSTIEKTYQKGVYALPITLHQLTSWSFIVTMPTPWYIVFTWHPLIDKTSASVSQGFLLSRLDNFMEVSSVLSSELLHVPQVISGLNALKSRIVRRSRKGEQLKTLFFLNIFRNGVLTVSYCLGFHFLRLKEHVDHPDKLPILIFPEGTCINNTSVMQFKKGSFEVGSVVYPVAIKVSSTLSL